MIFNLQKDVISRVISKIHYGLKQYKHLHERLFKCQCSNPNQKEVKDFCMYNNNTMLSKRIQVFLNTFLEKTLVYVTHHESRVNRNCVHCHIFTIAIFHFTRAYQNCTFSVYLRVLNKYHKTSFANIQLFQPNKLTHKINQKLRW